MLIKKILGISVIAMLLSFAAPVRAGDDVLWAIGGFIVGQAVNEHRHHRHYHDYDRYHDVEEVRVCVSHSPYDAGCYYETRRRHHRRAEVYYYDCKWYEDYPAHIRHERRHRRHEDPNCRWMP